MLATSGSIPRRAKDSILAGGINFQNQRDGIRQSNRRKGNEANRRDLLRPRRISRKGTLNSPPCARRTAKTDTIDRLPVPDQVLMDRTKKGVKAGKGQRAANQFWWMEDVGTVDSGCKERRDLTPTRVYFCREVAAPSAPGTTAGEQLGAGPALGDAPQPAPSVAGGEFGVAQALANFAVRSGPSTPAVVTDRGRPTRPR